jgi:hypothetical protein
MNAMPQACPSNTLPIQMSSIDECAVDEFVRFEDVNSKCNGAALREIPPTFLL